EENVFLLCKALVELNIALPDASDLFVVFLLSADKQAAFPIWCQKNSSRDNGFCVWDYHVICIQRFSSSTPDEASVWDLDTSLGLPVAFSSYVNEALKPPVVKKHLLERLFRVVSAHNFLRYFASDRRHMKTSDGGWLAAPPDYECIVSQDGTIHNLETYISVSHASRAPASRKQILQRLVTENLGCVLSEDNFYDFFEVL
ncbi:hypothetical protein SELMODRAFT_68426, partial [Selaginella moellendorffii]